MGSGSTHTTGIAGRPSHSGITLPLHLLFALTDAGSMIPVSGYPVYHSGSLQRKMGASTIEHTYTRYSEVLADHIVDAACGGRGSTVSAVLRFFRTTKAGVPLFISPSTYQRSSENGT